jgi:2-desacetyl-2-hydroxyethyl bacteriochlorophyllide A dehydrogenase
MKAIVFEKYGSPEVLRLKDVERPTPKDNEVLIKVFATSINPLDWHIMRGSPFIARLSFGLLKPKNPILGADVSGVVEAVGKNVKEFKVGDEVFGDLSSTGLGALAEYVCTKEKNLVLKPSNCTFEEAAAVPVAGLTALQSTCNGTEIKAGQKVLINGSSGGVGTFTVQLAKSFGANVTGVCSTKNLHLVNSIGADRVIDYKVKDFTKNGQRYDLIIDNVGNRTVADLKQSLNESGRCVIVGYTSSKLLFQHMFKAPIVSMFKKKKIGLMETAKMVKEDLVFIKELIEEGKVKPVIDRQYPLNETAKAIDYLEQGHAQGKVVITI